nr:uncharacterized mitochondrial protein AtMg00810-like [Tanacetum cinerariifolium]
TSPSLIKELKSNEYKFSYEGSRYTIDLLKEAGVLNAKPYKLPMDQHVKLQADTSTPLPDPKVYRRLIGKFICKQSSTYSDAYFPFLVKVFQAAALNMKSSSNMLKSVIPNNPPLNLMSSMIISTIRIFLAFASYMGFIVYQIDVNSAFLYGIIDEEVYVSQPPSFVDPKFPNKFYKKSWRNEFEELMKNMFQMSSMGELTFFLGLHVKQKEYGIFISQDKYVAKILKNFDFLSVKTASTPIETQKPLVKDEEADDVDVHLYRFKVTPNTSHLHAVKRIFRYLKGQPKLGLWYPKVSSFDMEAYSNSDYAGANLDKKSITGGFQFLGRRLIS